MPANPRGIPQERSVLTGTAPVSARIQAAPPDAQGALWQSFTSATSADAFCQSWLGLVALQVPSARLAAVLVESDTSHPLFGLLGLQAPSRAPLLTSFFSPRPVRYLWPSANPRASPALV